MVSGADVRQALQAGLWKALVDGSDRAAMRATCRDARGMVDELQDSTVLPVGPDTSDSAAAIAAYHRKLGAVRSLHVQYSGGGETAEVSAEAAADEHELDVQFVVAYSAALGAALPADSCTITMTSERQLPTPFMAVLLARVMPHIERLDIALDCYDNLTQLLTLLGPCTHLRSLRLLPADGGQGGRSVQLSPYYYEGSVLEALCALTRLHTLSGPWGMGHSALERLCAALPGLTTLGFYQLDLGGASGACISRQLHTLAGWRHSACGDARCQPSTCALHLLDINASYICGARNLQSSLPAVHQLESVVLDIHWLDHSNPDSNSDDDSDPGSNSDDNSNPDSNSDVEELAAAAAVVQRFAACADRWAWRILFFDYGMGGLEGLERLAQGSLATLQHAVVMLDQLMPADETACLRCLIGAAPNITTLAVIGDLFGDDPPGATWEALRPLCQAARLHTLRLAGMTAPIMSAGESALWLSELVRGLVRPDAEGECCRELRRVLLDSANPGALQACRRALADDGIDVSLDVECDECVW